MNCTQETTMRSFIAVIQFEILILLAFTIVVKITSDKHISILLQSRQTFFLHITRLYQFRTLLSHQPQKEPVNTKYMLGSVWSRCERFSAIVGTHYGHGSLNSIQWFRTKPFPDPYIFSGAWSSQPLSRIVPLVICTLSHTNASQESIPVQWSHVVHALKIFNPSAPPPFHTLVVIATEPKQPVRGFLYFLLF